MFRRSHIISISFFIVLLFISPAISDSSITGKVVRVSDGDTITVLQNNTEFKIRFYGIDCPESGQDFGKRAKQFTSGLVYWKLVNVIQKDKDRYGRVVGMVYVGDTCVNEQIIKNGFAWVYEKYCKDSICHKWRKLESQARNENAGLWRQGNPIPPWEYRRGGQNASFETDTGMTGATAYHGNVKSMIFHKAGCKAYNCKNCTAVFSNRAEAIGAGYEPCGMCRP